MLIQSTISLVTVLFGSVVFNQKEDHIEAEVLDIRTVGYYPADCLDSMVEAVIHETGYDYVALSKPTISESRNDGQVIKIPHTAISQAIHFKVLNN